MDKKQWLDTYFADEMPDCLPLPDIREKEGTRWAKHGFAVDRVYEAAELAAGFALLLGVYGGITDAAFAVRQGATAFPLRQAWKNEETPAALMGRMRQMLKEGGAFPWNEEEIREALSMEEGRGIALCLDDKAAAGFAGFALAVCAEGKSISVGYNAMLYTADFIRTLALSFREILQSLAASAKLSDVRVTAPETLEQLDRFNATEHAYDRSATIVDQFRARAAEFPGNMAVVYEERAYTYAEVDALSDKIAFYLAQQGLGRGNTVAVFIPRSEYMVIAAAPMSRWIPTTPTSGSGLWPKTQG